MAESNILMFPTPQREEELQQNDTARGIWMSLRYLEQEAVQMGHGDLAFLIGMAAMAARDVSMAAE